MPQSPMFDPLTQLRDIHLPEPVSMWPIAPGWWLLAALLGILGFALIKVVKVQRRKHLPRHQALAQLQRIRTDYSENGSGEALYRDLSMLLRRVALARFPRYRVAGLSGRAWARFLDKVAGNHAFTQGEGRLLLAAPYQANIAVSDKQAQTVIVLVENWIKRCLDV